MLSKFRCLRFRVKLTVILIAGHLLWFWLFSAVVLYCFEEMNLATQLAPRIAILIYPAIFGVLVRFGLRDCSLVEQTFVGMAAIYGCVIMILLNPHVLGPFWASVLHLSYGGFLARHIVETEA